MIKTSIDKHFQPGDFMFATSATLQKSLPRGPETTSSHTKNEK